MACLQVLDWQASFSDYLAYRDAEQAEERAAQQRRQQEERQQQSASAAAAATEGPPAAAEGGGGGGGGGGGAAAAAVAAKPLSNFERRQYERLEAEMEGIVEEQAALQRRIDGFDDKRNGYGELTEWTEQVSALAAKLEETEEKWLLLAERAEL